jgi:pyruvate/2-oxoglutarate dehydrogenase complex dihydrolipoamide acyltransferase (E2) component
MSAVEYALAALVAGAVVVLAVAAREVARLARTAEMIYALLYHSGGPGGQQAEAVAQPPPQQQPAAEASAPQQAAERQAEQQAERLAADECVVDLVRRYGCTSLADVKLRCGVSVRALIRMRREGKITITRDNKVCPK